MNALAEPAAAPPDRSPLRVLHVIPAVAPRYGGPSRAVFELARAARAHGAEVAIAATDADGPGRLDAAAWGRDPEPVLMFERQWSEAFKYSRPLARWLDQAVVGFDVVHVHAVFSHSSIAAAAACRRHGVPYLLRPLGTLTPFALGRRPVVKRLMWRPLIRPMIAGASGLHYTSEAERAASAPLVGRASGWVIPVPMAVPHAVPIAAAHRNGRPYVLALGRLHPVKRPDLLIDAFLDATRDGDFAEWELVLAGDGDPAYRAALEQRVEQGGGGDRVRFAGWLDGVAKERALREAAVLAAPSAQESFGISIVEAMSRAVPVVVAAQVDLAKDIERGGAGWVVAGERDQLARALSAVMSDPAQRRLRGAAGLALAKRFDPIRVGELLIEAYRAAAVPRGRVAGSPA